MNGARKAYKVVLIAFLVAMPIQYFLAGLGVFGETSYDSHAILGTLLQLVSLILLILAAVGRLGKPLLPMTAALFVLMVIQGILAAVGREEEAVVGAFHVLNALLIVMLAYHLFAGFRTGVDEPAAGAGRPSTL